MTDLAPDFAAAARNATGALRALFPPTPLQRNAFLSERFDAALWLFERCGASPGCVDFVDGALSGEEETLFVVNDLDTPWELVLGVDSFLPILSSQGDNEFDGIFDLILDVAVPTERATAGGLKQLFR